MTTKQNILEWLKDSPTISVAGLTLWGVSLDHWVLILTAVWAVFRAASAGWDFYWKVKDRLNGKTSSE